MQKANSASAKPTRMRKEHRHGFRAAVSGLHEPQLNLAEILRRFRQPLADAFQERDDLIGRCVCVLRLRAGLPSTSRSRSSMVAGAPSGRRSPP